MTASGRDPWSRSYSAPQRSSRGRRRDAMHSQRTRRRRQRASTPAPDRARRTSLAPSAAKRTAPSAGTPTSPSASASESDRSGARTDMMGAIEVLLLVGGPLAVGASLVRRWHRSWTLFFAGAVAFVASQVVHLPLLLALSPIIP